MAGVFICYRRADVPGPVGRLFDRLTGHFGEDVVFMDVASLAPGEHFDASTERQLSRCSVVLVVIGEGWLKDLAHDDNFARREIAAALRLELPIVPLLMDGARVPQAADLPADLHALLRNQAFSIRHATFQRDVDELIRHLERRFVPVPATIRARQLEQALQRMGVPYSWLGGLVRRTGPSGALAAGAFVGALAGSIAVWMAFGSGWEAGYIAGTRAVTAAYELAAAEQRNEHLVLRGFVTDGTQGIGDAVVEVTNQSSRLSTSTRSGQFGHYAVDLKELDIAEDSILLVDVSKPPFQPSRDIIQYRDGIEHRSILIRR